MNRYCTLPPPPAPPGLHQEAPQSSIPQSVAFNSTSTDIKLSTRNVQRSNLCRRFLSFGASSNTSLNIDVIALQQAKTCLQAVKTHCAFPLWMSNISTLTPAFWRSICSDAYESSIFLSQGVNGSAPFLSMQAQPMSLFSRSHLDDIRLFTCTFVVHSAARNFVSDFSCSCEEPYVFPHLMIFGSCERPTSAALTFFYLLDERDATLR
ncbi:hypothetical protein MVEN_02322700 [Mycena venus]|uniref:Uncharacterized protein n=1 Tax=Mycena venus TaxID=2733690 RepID=A0A8H7CF59_9AGAR|nr:hypothetical protein MVEN_02322700 [Mycena venus]